MTKNIRNCIGILGLGEVGKAIAKFYKNPLIRDLHRNEFRSPLDVLHVSIPGNAAFEKIVSENIRYYHPKLVVIHSTVAPGTTRRLFQKFKNVVHSPIRGVHPHLHEGIREFTKYIGCDDRKLGEKIARHFKKIGIKKVNIISPSCATEMGKLLDTTYYGLCIAFHAYAAKLCQKIGVNFEDAMTDFNQTYNEGYAKLGKKNVIRPVLFAPSDGIIGGHCVIPNAEILKSVFGKDALLESILRHKK